MRLAIHLAGVLSLLLAVPAVGSGQPLGTFRWQMEPYCNVLTLAVTQVGGLYRVEGTDDQCGAGRDRASVTGLAFPNPDGGIGMGLTIVTAPGGGAVHVDAEVALAGLSGTWRVAGGGAGAFTFTPGSHSAGYPRPTHSVAIPPSISLLDGGSIVARPDGDSGIPASGPGVRLMWYAGKAAFRAGQANADEWDDANIGQFSTAFGLATRAGYLSTAMGYGTSATGTNSTAMGSSTFATGIYSTAFGKGTYAGGSASAALGTDSVATGPSSTALGSNSTASGAASLATGERTFARGSLSFAGGFRSEANGQFSLAFGNRAVAHGSTSVALGAYAVTSAASRGSFVFADDSSSNTFASFAANEFVVRASGGVGFYTNAATTTGAEMAPGGGSWAVLSDANMKENVREVSGEGVLAKLAAMPVREWNYVSQDAGIRHMGPTAQDFRAAFGLGDFPLRINTIDADGVALAGVKALEARTRALQAEVDALRRRLEALLAETARER